MIEGLQIAGEYPAEAVALVVLAAAAFTLAIAGGILSVVLIRTRAIREATEAAHTASGQGTVLIDRKGRVLEANGPARSLFWPKQESEGSPMLVNKAILKMLGETAEQHHVVKLGADRIVEIWISEHITDSRLRGVRGVAVRDVTEQHRGQRHLVQLAHYDSLTGLGNRRLFVDRLAAEITRAEERGEQVALLYIDLDRFKDVNDTLGHGAGDALLKTLSERFQVALSDIGGGSGLNEPTVYRLAGDEFSIVIPHPESTDQIEQVAQRILNEISEPMVVADHTIATSGSVGIALFPEHANDVEDLVKHADSALYVAKEMGRARSIFYQPSFSSDADRSHRIAQELRNAIPRGELSLHYQPKVELEGDTVAGFEALLRWSSAELGFVGPQEFIPVAEDRGMISEIGAWCLYEACRQIRTWQDAGFTVVPVSVNVSSAQFRDSDVHRIVSDALMENEIHPSLLEIELTESLLLDDDETTGLALRDLRAIGVGVALDDFGTGYSALTYLNRFPLDIVKMDRGFLRDIEDSNAAAGIASAVISMSHSLGFKVIAEGVDSPPQAELLRSMKCDEIQGFLFSPAIPGEEATRFLATGGAEPPKVEPIRDLQGVHRIAGEADLDGEGPRELPVAAGRGEAEALRPTAPPRVLVIDMEPSTLGASSFRMTRIGADVHLMTGVDEASLFVSAEEPVLDLVIAPPEIDLSRLAVVFEKIKKNAPEHVPRLLIAGTEPDSERRKLIRQTGADWVLWEPYSDPELRFFINAARSNRNWKLQRQSVRVPIESIAWIRAGGQRGSGVVTSLSRRGAFIETADTYAPAQPIRLEFKVEEQMVSIFANVTRVHDVIGGSAAAAAQGIDVIFYEVDATTDATIAEVVEQIWMRYHP